MSASSYPTSARTTKAKVIFPIWFTGLFAILIGSLLPGDTVSRLQPASIPLSDKALHFSGYLLVAAVPAFGLNHRRLALACALSLIPIGICLEFVQRLIPGRSFELGDMAANTAGVLSTLALAYCWRPFYHY